MSNASNQRIPVDVVVREKAPCVKAEAVLRQMSWALSYPSAAVETYFREAMSQASETDGCRQCA